MAPNSPEYCVIFHAVAWAGGTITTLNPTYTCSEIHHQLKDSGANFLITVPEILKTAQQGIALLEDIQICVIGEVASIPSLLNFYGTPLEQQVAIDLDKHTLVLPYSSGTTGCQKVSACHTEILL